MMKLYEAAIQFEETEKNSLRAVLKRPINVKQ